MGWTGTAFGGALASDTALRFESVAVAGGDATRKLDEGAGVARSNASSATMTGSPFFIPRELSVTSGAVDAGKGFGGNPSRTEHRTIAQLTTMTRRRLVCGGRTVLASDGDLRVRFEDLLPKLPERALQRLELQARCSRWRSVGDAFNRTRRQRVQRTCLSLIVIGIMYGQG